MTDPTSSSSTPSPEQENNMHRSPKLFTSSDVERIVRSRIQREFARRDHVVRHRTTERRTGDE